MPPTTIRTAPAAADFTLLADHQSRTPDTFFGGKPVLHAHIAGATAWLQSSERAGLSTIFPGDSAKAPGQDEVLEQKVDVFVASDYLTLFNHSTDSGVQIPYPTIALHAVKNVTLADGARATPAIYMQLMIAPDEDEFETAGLTVIPPPASHSTATTVTAAEFFAAISDCSNLHPDPVAEGEEEEYDDDRIVFEPSETIEGYSGVFLGAPDGGLPPPMPGSGGWITAENVDQYFDADGNFIGNPGDEEEDGPEDLGEGAGRVRGRDEVEGEHGTTGTNGDTDTKRPRVE